MKRFFTSILLLFLTINMYAQHPVKSFIAEYRGKAKGDKVVLKLGRVPLTMASWFIRGEEKKLIRKISKLQLMALENMTKSDISTAFTKLSNKLQKMSYEQLMTVREGNDLVTVYAKSPDDDKLKELVLLVNQAEGDAVVLRLKGNFRISEIDKYITTFSGKRKGAKHEKDELTQSLN